jgi:signal transduction histidine kinase
LEVSDTRCRKEVPTGLPVVPVRTEVRHNLALAVKEAVTNALQHARAKTVWLRLKWNAPDLIAEVADDGIGFDTLAHQNRGNGLGNQAARMKDIGGSVFVESALGKGTRVRFTIRLPGKL